jgi:hypothetical protein
MKRYLLSLSFTILVIQACGGGGGGGGGANDPIVTPDNPIVTPSNPITTSNKHLSWIAPVARTDSSYLNFNSILGYRIYYGTSRDNLQPLMDIEDNDLFEYSFTTPSPGTYYFGITAYDMYGLESEISNLVQK